MSVPDWHLPLAQSARVHGASLATPTFQRGPNALPPREEARLPYEKILYSYYDWYSEYTIKRDAPKELKINQKCNISLSQGEDYVLGSKMYEEAAFNFVKPLKNVTEEEWKLINKTVF
ncbi:hypothetical protein Y032_0770g2217 [Ancylostoma ceylanicum]|uniref:Uncharacterized protein n=1 Tax=Ancylostoma ceylanicum TaxID=53326 RepID=A0A016WDK6_9BILA|nr:hypothetical protein Y032_0770g2217 [Ancylostoma ceylanicum]